MEGDVELLKKLKGVALSVLPIIVFVTVFQFLSPLPDSYYPSFLIAAAMLIIGISIFLFGIDMALVPVGEKIGSALMKRRSLIILLIAGFIVGFAITFAEPNAEVLSSQVSMARPSINSRVMLLALSVGVGVTIMLAFMRNLLHIPYKYMIAFVYALIFILAVLGKETFVSMAFDAGGSATGPLAVPFIMALGIGSARAAAGSKESDSFGFVGLQGAGAIFAVLVMGLASGDAGAGKPMQFSYESGNFLQGMWIYFQTALVSMAPLAAILVFFQLFSLKMPPSKFLKIAVGMIYSLFGMTLFLTAANCGFMPVAYFMGQTLASLNPAIVLSCSFILGAAVVVAEPSLAVLIDQVEEITSGTITRRMMITFMASGVAIALALVTLRSVLGFSYFWIIGPGYALAFIMIFFVPDLFGPLAFDSGGVAAGPIASAFILPFAIGIGSRTGGDLFGAIGCISMAPLLAIQLLGLIYRIKGKKKGGRKP